MITPNIFYALQVAEENVEENDDDHELLRGELDRRGVADAERELKQQQNSLLHPLVWIDLEMTGLDEDTDQILQIACIITDGRLNNIIEGEEIAINHPEEVLENMNEWCIKVHGENGLTQACRDSTVTIAEAEQRVLAFIQEHIPEPGSSHIAGNSVHADVAFLKRHMPRIIDHLHYRIVDVSSVAEICRRWFPRQHNRRPKKKFNHTALSDIKESIAQLKYYKNTIFK